MQLQHCVPVLVGCPLYNEASVLAELKHCFSTAVVRDYYYYMRLFLIRFAKFWLQRYKKNCRISHKRTRICNMMMQKNSFLLCFPALFFCFSPLCLYRKFHKFDFCCIHLDDFECEVAVNGDDFVHLREILIFVENQTAHCHVFVAFRQ